MSLSLKEAGFEAVASHDRDAMNIGERDALPSDLIGSFEGSESVRFDVALSHNAIGKPEDWT